MDRFFPSAFHRAALLLLLPPFLLLLGFGAAASAEEASAPPCRAHLQLHGRGTYPLGTVLRLTLTPECPDCYRCTGWGALGYLVSLPETFCEVTGLKPGKSSDPKWTSVGVRPWSWFSAAERKLPKHELLVDTAGWPEGDYQLHIHVIFQGERREDKLPDRYFMPSFTFTLEKTSEEHPAEK